MRSPTQIGEDLRAWMKRKGVTEARLAQQISHRQRDISVSQSWVSRIANGQFRRLTPAVRRVADYANIRVERAQVADQTGAAIIQKAVKDVWDGSVQHAQVIARIVRATRGLSK